MKWKVKDNYKDRSHTNNLGPQQECPDQKIKLKTGESSNSWKDC